MLKGNIGILIVRPSTIILKINDSVFCKLHFPGGTESIPFGDTQSPGCHL